MNNKKILRSTGIGFMLLLLSLLITGLFGIGDMMNGGTGTLYGRTFTYGLRASIKNYFQLWRPSQFPHETAYIGLVLILVAITITLTLLVMSLVKKKPVCIIPALLLGAAISYLPFILIYVIPMIQMNKMPYLGMLFMAGVTGLTLFSIYFFGLAVKDLLKDSLGLLNKAGGAKDEPCPCKTAVANGLSEEEVRAIVEQYLADHVEEKHAEEPAPAPAPAPAPQPEPEPEPEEEPEEEEEETEEPAPVEDNSPVGLAIKGKRRRASFETRLKNSEFDIRHKYYDLRDYIKWYGLRNRVSIPGDTFSYKRQRYVFVTIVGKHIRVYLNLDPAAYADSTIPVEPAAAKKYEDLPCLLRVKSDLSYRRAKKLVDDLMAKIGLEKPDEDEPKETQKQD